jgi:hypothetical protein
MQSDGDAIFDNNLRQHGSRASPLYAYHTYSAPEDIIYSPYAQLYRPTFSGGDLTQADTNYLAPVSATFPSTMQFRNLTNRENEDTLTLFNMTYQGQPTAKIHTRHGYNDPNPHVCSTRAPLHWQDRP